jgi:hypothetical protein
MTEPRREPTVEYVVDPEAQDGGYWLVTDHSRPGCFGVAAGEREAHELLSELQTAYDEVFADRSAEPTP